METVETALVRRERIRNIDRSYFAPEWISGLSGRRMRARSPCWIETPKDYDVATAATPDQVMCDIS